MSKEQRLEAHLFICTNFREKEGSCAQKGSVELRDRVKALSKDPARGWQGRVRVNAAGCLGKCEEGIAAVLYPQAQWMTHLTSSSVDILEKELSRVLK